MKKTFKIVLFILIGLFIIFVIYFLYYQTKLIWSGSGVFPFVKNAPTAPIISNSNYQSNSIPQKITIDDPSLNGLDRTFENIRHASLDNNISLLNQFYSEKTIVSFASSGGGRIIKTFLKDVLFSNLRKIKSSQVLVTVSQVEMSGHTENQDVIFIRESSGWKMGVVETKEYFKK